MTNEATGTIKLINETQHVSDKFRKREFVLTIDETSPYPQPIKFELTQDKVELIANYNVGDKIKVNYNLRGKEYNGNNGVGYFNSLQVWRIEAVGTSNSEPTFTTNTNDDDLPY